MHNHEKQQDKFIDKAYKCIFLGYPCGQKGYKVYDLERRKLFVIFYEQTFSFQSDCQPPITLSTTSTSAFINQTILISLDSNQIHEDQTKSIKSPDIESSCPTLSDRPMTPCLVNEAFNVQCSNPLEFLTHISTKSTMTCKILPIIQTSSTQQLQRVKCMSIKLSGCNCELLPSLASKI